MTDEMRLFERGEERNGAKEGDNSPIEHAALPTANEKEKRPPTVVFSFEEPEQRDELIALLELTGVERKGNNWVAWWPAPPDHGALTLDLGI